MDTEGQLQVIQCWTVQRTGTSDPHTVQGSAVYNNLENANYSDKAEDDGGSREG